jgi:acetyltransferase-like isoleucine patch superfamily enzyme
MTARNLVRQLRAVRDEIGGRFHRARDPVGHARSLGVTVGEDCRLISCDFGSEPFLVTIGDHVSATSVSFVTHDGGVWVFRDEWPDADVMGPIVVGSNVFIGADVMIMPGVTIGDNVVIGARSLVSTDIPSDCVALGVPAKALRSLSEYKASLEPRTVPTARLDREAKRRALLDHFGRGVEL